MPGDSARLHRTELLELAHDHEVQYPVLVLRTVRVLILSLSTVEREVKRERVDLHCVCVYHTHTVYYDTYAYGTHGYP